MALKWSQGCELPQPVWLMLLENGNRGSEVSYLFTIQLTGESGAEAGSAGCLKQLLVFSSQRDSCGGLIMLEQKKLQAQNYYIETNGKWPPTLPRYSYILFVFNFGNVTKNDKMPQSSFDSIGIWLLLKSCGLPENFGHYFRCNLMVLVNQSLELSFPCVAIAGTLRKLLSIRPTLGKAGT